MEELCGCKREKRKPHCPVCGSTTIYSLKSLFFHDEHGTQIKVFQCRKCGEQFNDFARENCNAPPPRQTKAQLQKSEAAERLAASGAAEYFQKDKAGRLKILEDIFKTKKENTQ